jgi:DNA-binding IclR family transcriptional regulator
VAGTSVDFHFEPGDPAHDILNLFLDGGEHSAAAIAKLTGLGLAECAQRSAEFTTVRLLDDERPGCYRPGVALRLNAGWSDGGGPGQPDVLTELAEITGGRARIGTLHGSGISYLEVSANQGTVGKTRRVSFGSSGPERAHRAALGQVLLAYAGDGVADQLLAGIPAGGGPDAIFDRDELDLSLSVVKLSGVAMTRGEPPTLEVAVPVFGPDGQVETALQISASGFQDADAAALDQLRGIAVRLSRTRDELPS